LAANFISFRWYGTLADRKEGKQNNMKSKDHRRFTVDDVFRMAEQAEQNAAEVYTRAADLQPDKQDVQFLRSLGEMEYGHKELFAAMRAQLPAAARELPNDDPYVKATLELVEMVCARSGEGSPAMSRPLVATASIKEILMQAIQGELEAVVFYDSLRDLVPADRGRETLDRIIAEEKSHFVALMRRLQAITASA
jgi:rubrerythrin